MTSPSRPRALLLVSLLFASSAAVADCVTVPWTLSFASSGTSRISDFTVADWNGDGELDAVAAASSVTSGGFDRLVFLPGVAGGTFDTAVPLYTGTNINDVASIDANGDGKLDVVLADPGASRVVYLQGNGDGTFGAPVISTGVQPTIIGAGDFAGDSKADVVVVDVADAAAPALVILTGSGNGTFVESARRAVASAYRMAIADVDGDARADVLLGHLSGANVSIFWGRTDGMPGEPQLLAAGVSPNPSAADYDDDGDLDIITADYDSASVTVRRNTGGRTFAEAVTLPVVWDVVAFNDPSAVVTADFTGDGLNDLAMSTFSGYVAVLPGIPGGSFGNPQFSQILGGYRGAAMYPLAAHDFEGDGRMDLLAATRNGGSVAVLRNRCGDAEVTLTTEAPVISVGQSASLRVSVSGLARADTPTGAVEIRKGEAVLAQGNLTDGVATLSVSGLAAGDHSLVATYAGDDYFSSATSNSVVQRVTTHSTSTTVTVSSTSVYGQSVGVAAAVASTLDQPITGMIEIAIGPLTATIGAPQGSTLLQNLPVGTHTVIARYTGDASHPPGTATPRTHIVTKAVPEVTFTTVIAIDASGSAIDIDVAVTPPGSSAPTGIVHLSDRGQRIATRNLDGSTHAVTFQLRGLAAGRHEFRAEYSGDDRFEPATSGLLTRYVFGGTGLQVDASGRADGIVVSWIADPNATGQVRRLQAPSTAWSGAVVVGTNPYSPVLDENTVGSQVYLYRYEATSSEGSVLSVSNIDVGVRATFTDDPLIAGSRIKAVHLQEIVNATNLLRQKAGLVAVALQGLAQGQSVRASHVTTLRTAINEARTALGASAVAFPRALTAGTVILASDVVALRDAVR